MKNFAIIIILILIFGGYLADKTGAEFGCISDVGGHCFKLQTRNAADKTFPQEFNLELAQQITGLEFLGINEDAKIQDVLVRIYVFGIGLVGVSAFLVLVGGGVMYLTAGDSKSRIDTARTWMGNAVFGLVLALLSWLILFTINPDLVKTINFENYTKIEPASDDPPASANP